MHDGAVRCPSVRATAKLRCSHAVRALPALLNRDRSLPRHCARDPDANFSTSASLHPSPSDVAGMWQADRPEAARVEAHLVNRAVRGQRRPPQPGARAPLDDVCRVCCLLFAGRAPGSAGVCTAPRRARFEAVPFCARCRTCRTERPHGMRCHMHECAAPFAACGVNTCAYSGVCSVHRAGSLDLFSYALVCCFGWHVAQYMYFIESRLRSTIL